MSISKKSVATKVDLTPELYMEIVKRADEEGKDLEEIIFETLTEKFLSGKKGRVN